MNQKIPQDIEHSAFPSVALRSYTVEPSLHQHSFHQIVLPSSGRMDIEIAGRAGSVDLGQGAIVAAGLPHTFSVPGANEFVVIDISNSELGLIAKELKFGWIEDKAFFPVSTPLHHLLRFVADRIEPFPRLGQAARSVACLVIAEITAPLIRSQQIGTDPVVSAVRFIEQHLEDHILVSDIARYVRTSERWLNVLFQRHLGLSPHAYLIRRRVDKAIELLDSTVLSPAEIAFRTGHSDQSALTKAMVRIRGTTPGRCRRKRQSLLLKAAIDTFDYPLRG